MITLLYTAQIPGDDMLATASGKALPGAVGQTATVAQTSSREEVAVVEDRSHEKEQQAITKVLQLGFAEVPNSKSDSGSNTNAILSATLTNGVIVKPEEVYSYNQAVGIRTPSRGFVDGQTVVNTVYGPEYVPGIGGGICRTSTAIHHAVLDAGLEVVERHNHSLPVSYSETGRDAAVAYGLLDYRFKNNTDWPVKVVVEADSEKIMVNLLKLVREVG